VEMVGCQKRKETNDFEREKQLAGMRLYWPDGVMEECNRRG